MTDAYAVIKTISRRRDDCDISLLVNMVHNEVDARAAFDRINGVCRHFLGFEVKYAGYLIHDDRVALGVRRRRPFVLEAPHCHASACIGRLAHRMDCHAAEPQDHGFLQRMANWFVGSPDLI
jgi:flagellar biosynthesis protein FlhG